MSDSKGIISFTVVHDKEKYKVDLDVKNGDPTIGQLAEQIAAVAKIPVSNQRLICKGRSLSNLKATLDSYGVRSGSRIMVLACKSGGGDKDEVEEDDRAKVMTSVDGVVAENSRKLDDIQKQFSDIEKGYLAAELQDEAVGKLKRQLAGCIEILTKQLERLDGLSLTDAADELKSRRKTTVQRIQVILDTADKLMTDINAWLTPSTAL